jgi:hypothetical protein
MSGSDLVGLITPTIRTVEDILWIYNMLKHTKNLPEAFHKVVEKLPLVQGNLLTIARSIRTDADEEDYQAIRSAVEKCKVKAEHLWEIFNAAVSLGRTFVLERYISAARRSGKGSGKVNQVEALAMKMLEAVRFLVENHSVQVTTQPRVTLLDEAIEDLSRTLPSLWDEVLINSGPGNQYMDDHIGYISSIINFGNTFSDSDSGGTVTWIKDVQRAAEIPSLMWELPWFDQSSRFPVRLPWDPCTTKDCVLPNGHLSSHEIWKPCTMDDCRRHRDHDGDHKMRSEELSEINARFEKRAKAAERFWRELADTVLEAMGYPQPEGQWRSKMARPIIKPFENTRSKASIQSPMLPRGVPSLPPTVGLSSRIDRSDYSGWILEQQLQVSGALLSAQTFHRVLYILRFRIRGVTGEPSGRSRSWIRASSQSEIIFGPFYACRAP